MTTNEVTYDRADPSRASLAQWVCGAFEELDKDLEPVVFQIDFTRNSGRFDISKTSARGTIAYNGEEGFNQRSAFEFISGSQPSRRGAGPDHACMSALLNELHDVNAARGTFLFCMGEDVPVHDRESVSVLRLHTPLQRGELPPLIEALRERSLDDLANAVRDQFRQPSEWVALGPREYLRQVAILATRNLARDALGDRFALENFYQDMSAIAGERYERAESSAVLTFGKPGTCGLRLKFATRIDLCQHRQARKLLEMASPECPALTDGQFLYGLAARSVAVSPERGPVVHLHGHHHWSLNWRGQVHFEVVAGIPRLPRRRAYEAELKTRLMEIGASEPAFDAVTSIARAAAAAGCGALVVVSCEAQQEADRLSTCAFGVEPVFPSDPLASSLVAIDGGILLDMDGQCHAVGVILDGMALEPTRSPTAGTQSARNKARGSRYNSATRYLASRPGRAVALVVSVDKHVDVLPEP